MKTNKIEIENINERNGAIIAIITVAILGKKLSKLTGRNQQKIQIEATNQAVRFLNSHSDKEVDAFMQRNFPILKDKSNED